MPGRYRTSLGFLEPWFSCVIPTKKCQPTLKVIGVLFTLVSPATSCTASAHGRSTSMRHACNEILSTLKPYCELTNPSSNRPNTSLSNPKSNTDKGTKRADDAIIVLNQTKCSFEL